MRLLPNGSVVLLKGGEKRVMIYGRLQKTGDSEKLWDYIACFYPEGNIDPNQSFLFDHSQIEKVFFTGYQDMEETAYNQVLQEYREKVVASGSDTK